MAALRIAVLAALLAGCGAVDSTLPERVPTTDEAAAAIAGRLAAFIEPGEDVGFLILPFEHDGRACVLGERLSTRVQHGIEAAVPGARAVVSPEAQPALVALLADQQSDLFDAVAGGPSLGKLHGYRYQILGRLERMSGVDEACWAHVKIIDLERGTFTAAESWVPARAAALAPPPAPAPQPPATQIRFGCLLRDPSNLNRDRPTGAFDVVVDDRTEIRFVIEAEREADVYLLAVGTSGRAALVFPNPFHPDPRLRAGERVTIPPRSTRPEWPPFVFTGAAGRESFFLVASTRTSSEVELLRTLDALERIRRTGTGADVWLEMPTPLPAAATRALVGSLRRTQASIAREAQTRRFVDLLRDGAHPGDIAPQDLALPRPSVRIDDGSVRQHEAPVLIGGELLIEEFMIDHR